MKKAFFFASFVLAGLNLMAFPLQVENKQGKVLATYQSENVADIQFADLGAVINMTNGSSATYSADEFGIIKFNVDDSNVAVSTLESDKSDVCFISGYSIVGKDLIELFDLNGKLVKTGNSSVSTLGIAPGVYVVKTNNGSVKVQVR